MNNYKRLTIRLSNEKIGCLQEYSQKDLINRLADLEDKIEDGTLIELPCKVGDMVFTIEGGIIEEYEVLGVLVQFEELFFKILRKRDCLCKFWGSRSVFLTKSEAEAKLKELQGE